jgi:dephospho-CoA kinase
MFVIGLTGSLGAGKSTVAAMFGEAGAAVYDADGAVHELYRGRAVQPVAQAFPDVPGLVEKGVIDRSRLSARVLNDPVALKKLEAIVHPLVRESETEFRAAASTSGRRLAVLEIPLLLETGGQSRVDAVVVVAAAADVRLRRVLRRPGMTAERFQSLSARQMPLEDKRRSAHFVVDNDRSLDDTRRQVGALILALAAAIAAR